MTRTVRDATFDVLRHHRLTTIFANPGSTEVAFLTDLPDDIAFVLALHEGSVVGMATGFATAVDRPALVNLHTTAGLGNAVGALATARVNRVPLVVLVGQQDRRHLALQPFLAGELEGLEGIYPVWVRTPARPQDVPGAVARAWHEARDGRGPALVIVPSDDWSAPAEGGPVPAPAVLHRATAVDPAAVDELAGLVAGAASPALVVGADADDAATWDALVRLAERLRCPVWQESFAARAGFPQDHPQFAGQLPAGRARLRQSLAGHDLVLAVGAPHRLLPARRPLGFLSAAMGGLGFALPAAIGVRMACPDRPVVAVVGDGSSLYGIQALWSAAHYGAGVLVVVLANGRYAVMDRLAEQRGGKPPWPAFAEVSVGGLAESLGCPARRVTDHAGLAAALDEVVPTLGARTEPLVLEVGVEPEPTFEP